MASPAVGAATAITTAAGADPTTTAAITTTASGSSFFVAFVTGSSATITDVTDAKSNTYSLLTSATNTNDGIKLWVYYATNGTGGASHTFTANPFFNNAHTVVGIEVTGADTSSIVDVSATAYDTGGSPFNCSATSTVDDTLFLGFTLAATATGTWTANGSFTLGETAINASNHRLGWAYKQVAGASANDPAWTSSNGVNNIAMVTVAIKSPAAAAGQPAMRRFGGVPGMTPGSGQFGRSW